MQALVAKEKEPITPFLAKIGALRKRGVSCILVMGGSGDYFGVSDAVICMDSYECKVRGILQRSMESQKQPLSSI